MAPGHDPLSAAGIAQALSNDGWTTIDDWLPPAHRARLAAAFRDLAGAGRLEPAAVGHGAARLYDP
ncbi:MAG: hypothetical protein ACK558_01305, partial [Pseudomonadota bacterium]